MTDNNQNNPFDQADEDLLATIRQFTQRAQREKEAANNPWAREMAAAAQRGLPEDTLDGLPPLRETRTVKAKKAKKRKKPFRRFVSTVLVIALLLCAGGYALAFALAGKVDSQPLSGEDRGALRAFYGSSRVTNILLLGMDTQGGGGRADTMLLLSVDRVHRSLKLTSFLRDSWVKMPSGKYAKLNTAVETGGPAYLMRTIGENFGVRADHYALVDFKVFENVIDALGGVSVPITKAEAKWLYKTAGPFKKMGGKDGLEEMSRQMKNWPENWEKDKSCAVKLDGLQALVFCRIRKLDDDFQRTRRQRLLMERLLEACKSNPLRLLGLMGDALSSVQTDMTQLEMANLAAIAPLLLFYDMEQFTVPAYGTWRYETKQGTAAISLDAAANAAQLKDFIYG